jgi:gliding motility-associated-like protein
MTLFLLIFNDLFQYSFMKTILLGLTFSFMCNSVVSQSLPFNMRMDVFGHRLGDLMLNEQDDMALLIFGPPFTIVSPEMYILYLNGNAQIQDGVRFRFADPWAHFSIFGSSRFFGNEIYVLTAASFGTAGSLLIKYDTETGYYWAKSQSMSNNLHGDFILRNNGNISLLHNYNIRSGGVEIRASSIHIVNPVGETISQKGFKFSYSVYTSSLQSARQIGLDEDSNHYVSGFLIEDGGIFSPREYFITKLDSLGEPLIARTLGAHELDQMYVAPDGIYLLGRTREPYAFTGNNSNAMLVKFDFDLNVVWARVYYADAFNYSTSTLQVLDDGLMLGYSTFGAFPVVLAKLDFNGNILWERGYPHYEPQLDVRSDGSLLLTTPLHFDETGTLSPQLIIAQTDFEGNLLNCETYETCLYVQEVPLPLDTMTIEVVETDSLVDVPVVVEPTSFSFSEFCDFPDPPSPEFGFPDTLCVGSSGWATDQYNVLASQVEWTLTGPDTLVVWPDSLEFSHTFTSPGRYQLRQRVWYLGCAYEYEREVQVLDSLQAQILPEDAGCQATPFDIWVSANRPLTSYEWSNGESTESIQLNEAGQYEVTVSDGYCQAETTRDISLLQTLLAGLPALEFTPEASVCEDALPYLLEVQSQFADSIRVGGLPAISGQYLLGESGAYPIQAWIGPCLIQDNFQLYTRTCENLVYLPNAFSPNFDGINDYLEPQGIDFEPIRLQVFDRWGGLLFQTSQAPFRWDGQRGNQAVNPGVYVVRLEYRNLRTGGVEEVVGDVVVVR